MGYFFFFVMKRINTQEMMRMVGKEREIETDSAA